MRHVIAAFSDPHAGSTLGLHPPGPTLLDDGGEYRPNRLQGWLWEGWTDWVGQVKAARKGADFTILVNGDACDGLHHRTQQLISGLIPIQFDIFRACIDPLLALSPDRIIFTRGTPAHVGENGENEESAAKAIAREGYTVVRELDTQTHTWWHYFGEYGPLYLDAAHHGSGLGNLPWTKPNAARRNAAALFMDYALEKRRHPDLVLRAHVHRTADSGNDYPVRYIAMPAWQMKTGFSHQRHTNTLPDIGGVIVQTTKDGYDAKVICYKPERGTIHKVAA